MTSTAFVSVTSYNGVDINRNPVHYGVVFAYEYPNDVAQLLLYHIYYTIRNYTYDNVVNNTVRSNNKYINTNNDDNVKVGANYYDDDTNNILYFYLSRKQVQVEALDDDKCDILVDRYAYDNDYDIHIIHDTERNNHDLVFMDDDDHNDDVIVNHHAGDSDRDVHGNDNTHIKSTDNVIYDNDDEDNNNHVDRCAIGMAQDDDLVENDSCIEQNDDFIYNSVTLVTALDTISSSSGHSHVCLPSELAPVSSFSSDISCPSSDFFLLSSECSLVRLEHNPFSLVASEETISSLSSHSLSPVLRVLCSLSTGLYSYPSSSCTKSPSCILISVPSIEPSFGPSITHQSLAVLRVIFATFCFINSKLNPYSLILMIIFMTMGLRWFSGSTHFTAIYIFIIFPPYCLLSQICAPVVATPFVLVNEYLGLSPVIYHLLDYSLEIALKYPSRSWQVNVIT